MRNTGVCEVLYVMRATSCPEGGYTNCETEGELRNEKEDEKEMFT